MKSYFSFACKPKNSHARRVLKRMRRLVQEEKPLAAMILYTKCRSKTQQNIQKILRVRTRWGIINKLSKDENSKPHRSKNRN